MSRVYLQFSHVLDVSIFRVLAVFLSGFFLPPISNLVLDKAYLNTILSIRKFDRLKKMAR